MRNANQELGYLVPSLARFGAIPQACQRRCRVTTGRHWEVCASPYVWFSSSCFLCVAENVISTFFFSYLKGAPDIGLNKERDIKEIRLRGSHHRQLMVEAWSDSCVCVEKLTAGHSCSKQIFLPWASFHGTFVDFSPFSAPPKRSLAHFYMESFALLYSSIFQHQFLQKGRYIRVYSVDSWGPQKCFQRVWRIKAFLLTPLRISRLCFNSLSHTRVSTNYSQAVWRYSVICPFIMLLNSCVNISTRVFVTVIPHPSSLSFEQKF